MAYRSISFLIGYVFGSILTAEIVVRKKTGKSVSEYGTGNPGMANVMHIFGFRAGAAVLAGDLLKTLAACAVVYFFFNGMHERILVLYAGLGATVGHNFPAWRKFRGGKGVSATCNALFLFSPLCGLLSSIAGLITVLLTKYLCIGAVVIPLVFCIPAFVLYGSEAGILSCVFTLIMAVEHFPAIADIKKGSTPKTDIIAKLRK